MLLLVNELAQRVKEFELKEKIQWALSKLRITDEMDRLSLTNLVVFASVYKLMVAPGFDAAAVGALITSVSAYQYSQMRKSNA